MKLVTLALAVLFACSGGDEDDDAMMAPCLQPTFTSIYGERLAKPEYCTAAGCHDASRAGGQSFVEGQAAALTTLLGDTVHPVGREMFPRRVVPGEPDQSFLYEKLTAANPAGDVMPLGKPRLQQCDVDAIRAWIASGAMDD